MQERDVTIHRNVTSKTNICLTQGNMMFSVHRHEKSRTIFMRTVYSSVMHGFIMQLSDSQCHGTQTFHILLQTIHLKIITNRAKSGVN